MKAIFKKLDIRIESPGLEPIKTEVANGDQRGLVYGSVGRVREPWYSHSTT